MTNSDSRFFGRREMGKGALLGGASLLFGAQTTAQAQVPAAAREHMSVRDFGATGDGKTDDTKAIQRALDAAGEVRGTVFVPPGVYLSADLKMRPNTALVGVPTWDYHKQGDVLETRERRRQVPAQYRRGSGRHD